MSTDDRHGTYTARWRLTIDSSTGVIDLDDLTARERQEIADGITDDDCADGVFTAPVSWRARDFPDGPPPGVTERS